MPEHKLQGLYGRMLAGHLRCVMESKHLLLKMMLKDVLQLESVITVHHLIKQTFLVYNAISHDLGIEPVSFLVQILQQKLESTNCHPTILLSPMTVKNYLKISHIKNML